MKEAISCQLPWSLSTCCWILECSESPERLQCVGLGNCCPFFSDLCYLQFSAFKQIPSYFLLFLRFRPSLQVNSYMNYAWHIHGKPLKAYDNSWQCKTRYFRVEGSRGETLRNPFFVCIKAMIHWWHSTTEASWNRARYLLNKAHY